jgi:hypothetical protein
MTTGSALGKAATIRQKARSVRAAMPPRDAAELRETIARVRASLIRDLPAKRVAGALSSAFEMWRNRTSANRRDALRKIAESSGWSYALLDESMDALLRPFARSALDSLAVRVRPTHDVFGFVMPGNLPGAGVHELTLALMAGAGVIVKAASAERIFFAEFARSVREVDPIAGERLAVFSWDRSHSELTEVMREACDALVALGDDSTLAALEAGGPVVGFGSRLSAAFMGRDIASSNGRMVSAVARDVTLFEQQGCLSPHHVFVEAPSAEARNFAAELASEMAKWARRLPPPARLPLEATAAIRREREVARWRGIGGEPVTLFEGPQLGWTVIFDPTAQIAASPGYRTIRVSAVASIDELCTRLAPAAGRLEAIAVASDRSEMLAIAMRVLGVTYLAAPGEIQSPPLEWPHGGGAMLELAGFTA